MRLGARATDLIGSVVNRAMSGECVVSITAPNRSIAHRMFCGVTGHIEAKGGQPDRSRLAWQLPNGSEIRIEVAA